MHAYQHGRHPHAVSALRLCQILLGMLDTPLQKPGPVALVVHVAGLSFRALIALPDVTAAAADAAFERCPWHRRLEQQRLCHLVVEVSLQDPAVLEVIAGNAL